MLVLYASSPICAVVGALRIKEVVRTTPQSLWQRYSQSAGVSQDEYWSYYERSTIAEGLIVDQAIAFEKSLSLQKIRAVWPGFMPPQSYRYVEARMEEAAMRLALASYPDQELVIP